MTTFTHTLTTPIPDALTKLLTDMGFTEFTPIQQQALPVILEGKDLLAQAQTGSGKTLAFALGMLLKVNPSFFGVQGLVMCPTRELADQVCKEIRRLARFMDNIKVLSLCGGLPFGPQIGSLEHGAHIVVGTPGRLLEHLRKGSLKIQHLRTLVLDEADRMLDMGFIDSIRTVIEHTPPHRQTLLFSATYPETIAELSHSFQDQPVNIKIEVETQALPDIEQHFVKCHKDNKLDILMASLRHFMPRQAIVFCNTKIECQAVADWLDNHRVSAKALHGDLDQRQRDQVLVQFSHASICILVATDVAARGIDVKEIDAVINYDMTRDIDVHTHRIGRTGRAGAKGIAINLVTDKDSRKVSDVEQRFTIVAKYTDITIDPHSDFHLFAPMTTLVFDAGRKNKLRPGDIVGALTAGVGLQKEQVGKIDVFDFQAYVAIEKSLVKTTLKTLENTKIKGRNIKVRQLRH